MDVREIELFYSNLERYFERYYRKEEFKEKHHKRRRGEYTYPIDRGYPDQSLYEPLEKAFGNVKRFFNRETVKVIMALYACHKEIVRFKAIKETTGMDQKNLRKILKFLIAQGFVDSVKEKYRVSREKTVETIPHYSLTIEGYGFAYDLQQIAIPFLVEDSDERKEYKRTKRREESDRSRQHERNIAEELNEKLIAEFQDERVVQRIHETMAKIPWLKRFV